MGSFRSYFSTAVKPRYDKPGRSLWILWKVAQGRPRLFVSISVSGAFYALRHVYSSAWNNSVPTGRIFIKFDSWVSLKNMPTKLKFHNDQSCRLGFAAKVIMSCPLAIMTQSGVLRKLFNTYSKCWCPSFKWDGGTKERVGWTTNPVIWESQKDRQSQTEK
jgi:hypothetical protein